MSLSAAELHNIKHRGERAFPEFTWWLYLGILGAATVNNLIWKLWAWSRRRSNNGRSSSAVVPTRGDTVSATRFPAAAITASRIAAFRWKIPAFSMNVLEFLLTILYILLLFCLEFTSTNGLAIDFWANRTGHIVAIQIPLIVALSWKNSLFSVLTGISYEKLNLLHRVCARSILLLVYVHLFGTLYNLGGAGGSQWFYAKWTYCGPIAGFSLTLLVTLSVSPIRKRFYEFFVKAHMLLVIIIMVSACIHISLAPPGFGFYIWPAFVFWAFDRLCRYTRWFMLNDLFQPQKSTGTIELITPDTLLFTVNRHIPFGWKAGQHAYLNLPTLGKLQSHPFTIATVQYPGEKESELVFIVRVREGLTKKLKEHVSQKGSCETPIFLDGPYGQPLDLTPFSTCVFIAGGSGISYTLPRLEELLNQVALGDACARRIVFVWAIRQRAHLKWVATRLSKLASNVRDGVSLTIHIHITSGSTSQVPDLEHNLDADVEKDGSSEGGDAKSNSDLDALTILQGRPDVFKILESEVSLAGGPVSVDVSGPVSMLAATRLALTNGFAGPTNVLKGTPTVQLNVEEFSM